MSIGLLHGNPSNNCINSKDVLRLLSATVAVGKIMFVQTCVKNSRVLLNCSSSNILMLAIKYENTRKTTIPFILLHEVDLTKS